MGDLKIIQDFDSLWFFSNILSSSSPPPPPPPPLPPSTLSSGERTVQSESLNSPKSPHQQTPRNSNPKTEQFHFTSTDSQVNTSSDSDSEFESETESEIQEMESPKMKVPVMEKKEERSRKRENREKFGFDFEVGGLNCKLVPVKPRLPKSGNLYLKFKMPPLSDGMAMKKHLKLWAHAVACTVR